MIYGWSRPIRFAFLSYLPVSFFFSSLLSIIKKSLSQFCGRVEKKCEYLIMIFPLWGKSCWMITTAYFRGVFPCLFLACSWILDQHDINRTVQLSILCMLARPRYCAVCVRQENYKESLNRSDSERLAKRFGKWITF